MVERLADKGFLADRMFDTLITVYRTFKGFQEKELNIMTLASNMAEGLVIRTMLGQGGGKLKLSGRIIVGIVIAIRVVSYGSRIVGGRSSSPMSFVQRQGMMEADLTWIEELASKRAEIQRTN